MRRGRVESVRARSLSIPATQSRSSWSLIVKDRSFGVTQREEKACNAGRAVTEVGRCVVLFDLDGGAGLYTHLCRCYGSSSVQSKISVVVMRQECTD